MSETLPYISLIIPTYNREEALLETLEAVLKIDYPKDRWQLLIVDQTKEHGKATAARLAELSEAKRLTWFHPPEIDFASLTMARNFGVTKSQGADILVFVDDDVEVKPDFLRQHAAGYAEPEVGAIAGKNSVPGTEYPQPPYKVGRISWFGAFHDNFHDDTPQYVDNFVGCNFSLRASLMRDLGAFDGGFIGNAMREESDMALRVRELGYKIKFFPAAALLHKQVPSGGTRQTKRMQFYYSFFSNHALFYAKHAPAWRFPFFVLHLWRPILACWLYYGKGSVYAMTVPWRGLAAGRRSAAASKKQGVAVLKRPKVKQIF